MVYALVHPDTLEVRYVGKTKNAEKRMRGHRRSVRDSQLPVYRWWRKVLGLTGHEPSLVRLGEGDSVEEIQWIARLKAEGARLLNCTPGGEGMTQLTPEARQRQRERTREALAKPEVKQRHAAGNRAAWAKPGAKQRRLRLLRAIWLKPEIRQKRSLASRGNQNRKGIPHTEEMRAHLAAGLRRLKHTAEQDAKIAASLRGQKKSPTHVARMRAARKGKGLGPRSIETARAIQRGTKAAWNDPAKKAARLEKCRATRAKNKGASLAARASEIQQNELGAITPR